MWPKQNCLPERSYQKLTQSKMHLRFITQVGGETALTNDDVDFLLNAIGANDQDDISIDQLFKILTTE